MTLLSADAAADIPLYFGRKYECMHSNTRSWKSTALPRRGEERRKGGLRKVSSVNVLAAAVLYLSLSYVLDIAYVYNLSVLLI